MSELEDTAAQVTAWLAPLPDAAAPCGPDLEYDNEFLALTQAAAGKPESQFGAAEAPDWRGVVSAGADLFKRTRDLRVAITWLRGALHLQHYGALAQGLRLINGLIETHWEQLHPLPDPDDGDPYGRVNALTLLREHAGLLGDLRETVLCEDRAVGVLRLRDIETLLALPGAPAYKTEFGKEQATQMLHAAVERTPGLRAACLDALAQARALAAAVNDRLGSQAPDLRPLVTLAGAVAGLLPADASAADDAATGSGAAAGGGAAATARGLSGAVTSRDEALRAIDLVIDYLERAEPTNPAPLFLRRARKLIGHNFLQLMKVLAPDALAEVARVVGVDPDSVEDPAGP